MVVGGAGYIGSHMVLALRDAGYGVVVFDNLSRGHSDAVRGATMVEGDLRSIGDIKACFQQHRIDLVMHFAALAYVGESVTEPDLYYQNNVVGALNLLTAMRSEGIQRLVFSSTCATYGEPERVPIDESHPQRPINPYGRTKLMVENALTDFAALGMQSVSLRYFNAAGSDPAGRAAERHNPETHLIPLVLGEALRIRDGGNPLLTTLNVFGDKFPTRDGTCVRDYIHVSDLCAAHLLAMERLLESKVRGAEAFNLANGIGFTVLEVIQACRDVTGQPVQYRAMPPRAGDPANLVGDAGLAKRVLGWEPGFTNLHEIIRTAWDSFAKSPAESRSD